MSKDPFDLDLDEVEDLTPEFDTTDEDVQDALPEPETIQPPVAQPAQRAAAPAKRNTQVAQRAAAPLDFSKVFSDFGPDIASNPAVVSGPMGLTVSRYAIDRIKFTKEKKDRISILSDNVIAVKTHYHEDLGQFLCTGGTCCNLVGSPRVRYLLPIVVYETDAKGRILSKEVKLKVLALGQEQYDSIVTIAENSDISISDMDVIVTCSDAEYQKCTYTKVDSRTPGASWKKDNSTAQFVAEEFVRVKSHIIDPIARQITDKQIMEKLSGADAGATPPSDLSMDDVFGGGK